MSRCPAVVAVRLPLIRFRACFANRLICLILCHRCEACACEIRALLIFCISNYSNGGNRDFCECCLLVGVELLGLGKPISGWGLPKAYATVKGKFATNRLQGNVNAAVLPLMFVRWVLGSITAAGHLVVRAIWDERKDAGALDGTRQLSLVLGAYACSAARFHLVAV